MRDRNLQGGFLSVNFAAISARGKIVVFGRIKEDLSGVVDHFEPKY